MRGRAENATPRQGLFEPPRALHMDVHLDFMNAWISTKPLEVTLAEMW